VVQVNSRVPDGELVPIGWVAVGDPARVLPPDRHDQIWEVQSRLDFPGTVYGVRREASARERMVKQTEWFAAHRDDRTLS
jgi:carbonic anhydrase/acetyltransferase-like protein (isoleucine patch superfamily)